MTAPSAKSLDQHLNQQYRFNVIADEEGGYVIEFPDLPGCMTQVEEIAEVSPMAEEIRPLWIETAYEMGVDIPPPSYPPEYSGKFNLRLPRSLHRQLAESAAIEGVSLNQHVVSLLSSAVATHALERRLDSLEQKLLVTTAPDR